MKNINYKGTLTDDLKLLNKKNKKSANILEILLKIVLGFDFSLIIVGIIFNLSFPFLCNVICSTNLIICSSSLVKVTNRKLKQAKTLHAESNVTALSFSLSKNSLDTSEKQKENYYTTDDIKNAIVIETSREASTDPSDYDFIDVITSDIYFINNAAKIKVLREIKKIVTNGKQIIGTSDSTLSELEEEEQAEILPVKQVLKKLTKDKSKNEKNFLQRFPNR